jgi:hypothetical protein
MRAEIETDYDETVIVTGRATTDGGAHLFVWAEGEGACTVSLTVPQVKALRKALKKAAGL